MVSPILGYTLSLSVLKTDFAFDYLLLAWVSLSIMGLGVAVCARATKLTGISLVAYGAAIGVAAHGIFGVLIAVSWRARYFFAAFLFLCSLAGIIDLIRSGALARILPRLAPSQRYSLLLWITFLISCVALVHCQVRWPARLQPGVFIFEKHRVNTKIQYLTRLPADNYIPYTVTEFLLRGISFKEHHPVLPGNEVSNRTILMSLVALPFRTISTFGRDWRHTLGTFSYVGTEWPDVESLNDDGSYHEFLVIGLFLNSLLLVGLLALFDDFTSSSGLLAAVLLFVTNPYFVGQTIFTWPKAMAGFFIVLAWDAQRRGRNTAVVAALAALAYHSHPSSIVVAISLGLWVGYDAWRSRAFRPILIYAATFMLIALPWVLWTKGILRLPSNMIWQNFAGPGTDAAFRSPLQFVWVRLVNAFNTFAPYALGVYPFQADSVLSFTVGCLPFAVGLLLLIPALRQCEDLAFSEDAKFLWFGFVLPASVILLLFSCPAFPVLHGWQPIIGALLFLGVMRLRRNLRTRSFLIVMILQVALNVGMLWAHGSFAGVHWSNERRTVDTPAI